MNVQITPDYRLTADDRNFIVLKRFTVDPTKAPNWAVRLAVNPTLSAAIKTEWRENPTGCYYPLTTDGMRSAIESAVIKSAAASDATTVAELLAAVQTFTDAVGDATYAAGLAKIDGKLASVAADTAK